MHVDTAEDTVDHRRLVVMNDGGGRAYIAMGTPQPGTDEPRLGPRYDWVAANALDRHDLMLFGQMCLDVARELPWVDIDADGKHVVAPGATRFS